MYKRIGRPAVFIVLLVIAAIVYVASFGISYKDGDVTNWVVKGAQETRLGIDINGGVEVTFSPPKNVNATADQMKSAAAIIEQRLDNQHITDRDVYTDTKTDRIIVRYPWKSGETNFDPETAIQELGSMANLTFKGPDGSTVLQGADIKNAVAQPVTQDMRASGVVGDYFIQLNLNASGTKKFAAATQKYLKKSISIYMDKTELSAPTVDDVITDGKAQISGSDFTAATASALANKINAGALPFALQTDNYSTISPTLGSNSLHVMLMAGLVAFILICLFMILYYRLPGFIACLALCGHVAGTILLISWPQFTLTLPGIAGVILSIGMGVDCNIITAERIKEELRSGRSIDAAIDQGFDRSFSAIFDGNITVVIVGVILWMMGSSTVLSFGYTLVIGVIFNFLMGIIASRMMLKSVSKFGFLRHEFLFGKNKNPRPDLAIKFIEKRKVYYTISLTLIAVGILVSVIFGAKLDIEFKGGAMLNYTFKDTAASTVEKATVSSLASKSLSADVDTLISTDAKGNKNLVIELDKSVTNVQQKALTTALQKQYPSNSIKESVTYNTEPEIGREFLQRSILAVLLASLLIILYIWIRFRHIGGLPAGLTAFIALLHDVIMAFVAFSIFRIPLGSNFIAIALTILGYSINDTIVVYDRIRENRGIYGRKQPFMAIVDKSINQSFARSINTTLATFVSIAVVCGFAIYFNIDSIRNFAMPMMVGVVTGCYSTICIAGPLWVTWVNHKEKLNASPAKK